MNYQGLYGRRKRRIEELIEVNELLFNLRKKEDTLRELISEDSYLEWGLKSIVGGKIADKHINLKMWLLCDHMNIPNYYEKPLDYNLPDEEKRKWIADIIERPIEWFIDYEATIFVLMAWKHSDLAILGKDVVEKIICRMILK